MYSSYIPQFRGHTEAFRVTRRRRKSLQKAWSASPSVTYGRWSSPRGTWPDLVAVVQGDVVEHAELRDDTETIQSTLLVAD